MNGFLIEEDCSSTARTTSEISNGIRITIDVDFIPERSDIPNRFFAYSYNITLENLRDDAVRLLNRHWLVYSGGKQIADIKGEGVVGEQPVIGPNESYNYESWTFTRDSHGSMKGAFTFVTESLDFFDVELPEFCLVFFGNTQLH